MSAAQLLNPKAESRRRGEALRVNISAGEGSYQQHYTLRRDRHL